MWIFLNDCFVSVVEDRDNSACLVVRGRRPGDVDKFLEGCIADRLRVVQTDHADYRFRVSVPRRTVERALQAAVMSLDYPNFKDSVEDDERHAIYARVWSAALELDERRRLPLRIFDDTREPFDDEDEA